MPAFLKVIRTTTKPVQVKEAASVELRRDAAAMWSFMWDPASSVVIDETTEIGVTLPGSPHGVGEIQVFIQRTAGGRRGVLHEVVELEPGRRAVTRSLASAVPAFGALTIESLGPGSCRLTQEHWVDLPAGVPVALVQECRDSCQRELRKMMSRLSELALR
ncbi:hypothetical protein [Actinoplanes aureus]|uniref:SRPBCC family protein n=1 Tax=Actinoplanes aureus TaxID=2792083 RepID=A0A931C4Q6_9ACTN|nr:hypothetical protein [Actinoplanes aureus]MBG0561347.1 hypothetical protein [Actinoplanes aureus]